MSQEDKKAAAALSVGEAAGFHRIRVVDWNEIAQEMPLGDDPYANGYHDAMNAVTRRLNAYPTTPQPGGGVVEANALSADELVELDKLVADVGPQHALNIFVELRAAIAGKVDEADRSIAELKRRTAAPSAKGG